MLYWTITFIIPLKCTSVMTLKAIDACALGFNLKISHSTTAYKNLWSGKHSDLHVIFVGKIGKMRDQ